MNRWKAGGIHLLLSACVVAIFAGLIFSVWYPGKIAVLEGVGEIFLILLGVDVVLGPLLTTIVYAPNKRNLKFDLVVIIGIQIIALIYGGIVLTSQRPAFIVFSVDRFVIVAEGDISREGIQYPELRKANFFGPVFIGADILDTEEKQKQISSVISEGGKDREFLPQYYHPYSMFKEKIRMKASNLNRLKLDGGHSRQINSLASKLNVDTSKLGFLPIVGKAKDMAAIINLNDSSIVGYLDVDPWY